MEQSEINNPIITCYRENYEETVIITDNIITLELLYVITRWSKNEISQSYIYFGKTSQTNVIQTNEGDLFWNPESEILNREYTKTFTAII
jgi:hypothetical protein